jgi:gas vesicle protein
MSYSISDIKDLFRPRSSAGPAIATGLISAAAAAGITYFLFGTDTGAEKREKIKYGFGKMKSKAGALVGETGELADVSREIYSDMKSMLKDKADILAKVEKDEVSALADRIRNHWEEIREDIEDTVDKVAEDAKETMKN